MRVRRSQNRPKVFSGKKTTGVKKTDQKGFSGLLGEKGENIHLEQLKGILKDIDQKGEALKNSGQIADLKAYKKEVRRFLKLSSRKGFRTKQISRIGPDGSMKLYNIIEKVDEALTELTEALLDQESRNLDLVGKIEEIRGLLVDVFA